MGSLSFFIRTMAITAVVVILLQVHWGTATIEDYTMSFLTTSSIVKPVDETAKGAVIFIRNSWSKITQTLNTNFANALRKENQPGSRDSNFTIKRSEEYLSKKKDQVEEGTASMVGKVEDSTSSIVEKFKNRAVAVGHSVKSKFIDETKTPGHVKKSNRDKSDAAHTTDDDLLEE